MGIGGYFFVVGGAKCDAEVSGSDDPAAGLKYPTSGAEWVELFVIEMMNASNMDDAKSRASRMLEALEKSICARASAETERNIHQVIYYVFMFLSIVIVNPNTKQINMCFHFLLIPSKIFVLIVWFTEFRKI